MICMDKLQLEAAKAKLGFLMAILVRSVAGGFFNFSYCAQAGYNNLGGTSSFDAMDVFFLKFELSERECHLGPDFVCTWKKEGKGEKPRHPGIVITKAVVNVLLYE